MTNEVTGYQLREAIHRWQLRRDTANKQFQECLWAFPGEETPKPDEVAKQYNLADWAVAYLQQLQQDYNQRVMVEVRDYDGRGMKKIALGLAVKLVGGAGRLEKMFRSAATDTGRERYRTRREITRKADEIQAQRQLPVKESLRMADEASRYASSLRAAIGLGNSTKYRVEISTEGPVPPDQLFQ